MKTPQLFIPAAASLCTAFALACPVAAQESSQAQTQTRTQTGEAANSAGGGINADRPAATGEDRQFISQAARGGMKEVALGQLAVTRAQRPEVRELASQIVRDHTSANQELRAIAKMHGITVIPGAAGAGDQGGTASAGTPSVAGTSRVDPGDSGFGGADIPSPGADSATGASPGTPPPVATGGVPSGTAAGTPAPGGSAPNTTTPLSTTGTATDAAGGAGNTGAAAGAGTHHHEEVKALNGKSGPEFDQAFLQEMERCHAKDIQAFEQAKNTVSSPRLKGFIEKTLPVLKAHAARVKVLQEKQ